VDRRSNPVRERQLGVKEIRPMTADSRMAPSPGREGPQPVLGNTPADVIPYQAPLPYYSLGMHNEVQNTR